MMKLLFVSDSFKGSLSSEETAALLTSAARDVFGTCDTAYVPVADGGEGTVEAVMTARNGHRIEVDVHGPLMEKTKASYAQLSDTEAIIEMAAASGLPMVPENKRNPLNTTSYGTGELILDAMKRGFTNVSIAIGGSATNDGGMGCARALGVRFLDSYGHELEGFGRDLEKVAHIDMSGLHPGLHLMHFTIMCDVKNPLCGPDGATYTFGKQKGGTPANLDQLEQGMLNYRDVIRREFDIDPDQIEGAGAAGGLGTALRVFLGGRMKSGIETVLELIQFDRRLEGVNLVVTGEGRTDWQSCYGKVLQGVGAHAKAMGIPAIALSGSLGAGAEKIFDHGIESIMTTVDAPMNLTEAIENAKDLYYKGAVRMFRFVKCGIDINKQQLNH